MTHIRYILHPFIATTAVATFFHNLWTISFVFGGYQPAVTDFPTFIHFAGWLLPGVLISFSLDVGLLATAVQLSMKRTWQKAVTFGVLAGFMFVGQSYYLLTHTAQIDIGNGVSPSLLGYAMFIRDIIVILLPAMLPLSTILYVLSYDAPETSSKAAQRENRDTRRASIVTDMGNAPAPDFQPSDGKSDNGQETRLALPFGRGRQKRK